MAALEAERAVLTRWAEEAKVLVKECEASRVAGLVNSLRVLSLTLCAESGACADEKEMEEEKMEEVEKEEKVCLEESNSALRTALEKAERVTHELEDRVTGLEAAARRSQGAWEAKEKEAKRLALEVESVRRLNDELKMENEGLKRCVGEVSVSVNGVSEEKEETEKESVNEEENGVNEEKASEEEKEVEKEGVNEEENAMTEEKEMEEEKASEVEKEEMKVGEEEEEKEVEKESVNEEENGVNEEKASEVEKEEMKVEKEEEEKEEEEKEALKKKEKMEEVVVEEKAEEEKAKEATEEKESGMEGENGVNQKENKKEMEEEQKKEEAAYEKEETPMKGENTVNAEKEEKEEEQNEKEQKEKENKETTNEQATTPETDNHPPKAETEKLSQKRAAEENPNPPSKKPYTLTLSTLKLRIRYAFEKWNPKWMRRMKAVSDKLDKMTKTPEEGFKEMCTMYCIGRGVMCSYKWDEAKIQEMEKIQSQSDYDAMVQEWKKD